MGEGTQVLADIAELDTAVAELSGRRHGQSGSRRAARQLGDRGCDRYSSNWNAHWSIRGSWIAASTASGGFPPPRLYTS